MGSHDEGTTIPKRIAIWLVPNWLVALGLFSGRAPSTKDTLKTRKYSLGRERSVCVVQEGTHPFVRFEGSARLDSHKLASAV